MHPLGIILLSRIEIERDLERTLRYEQPPRRKRRRSWTRLRRPAEPCAPAAGSPRGALSTEAAS